MSYVANVLKQHGTAIVQLRKRLRDRKQALPVERNDSWGMDMTFVTGADCKRRMLLGLVDHGTRVCIALKKIGDKNALTIWHELIALFKEYGIPKRIRVDNERSFNAGWLRFALGLLGVKIHTTAPFSPWQNGKIERFFKSFKTDSRHVVQGDLTQLLKEWRWFYNHARPHMGIGYRTPAEAWNGWNRIGGQGQQISLWSGALRAFYFPD